MTRAILLPALILVFLPACGGSRSPAPAPGADARGPDLVPAVFPMIQKLILKPKCVSCHSGSDAPHGIELTSYDSIVRSSLFPPLVIPGKPEKSSLYKSVRSGKMPKKAAPLTEQEINAIRIWIENGARENPSDPAPSPSPSPSPAPAGSDCLPGEPDCS